MPRQLRIEYPGAVYHVLSRGDHQEAIYRDDQDRQSFVSCLEEGCAKTGWQVHAYVLMGNHYHLLIETPGGHLIAGMKWLQGTYTQRFNSRHKVYGHLFQGRYKALNVDEGQAGYFQIVSTYIHLNPVRAGLVRAGEQPLKSYRWSSYRWYVGAPGQRPGWLRVGRLLGEMGIPKDSVAGRQEFARRMEEHRRQEEAVDYRAVRRGWCLGDEAFRKELLAQMGERVGESHYGSERQESGEEKAERIVEEELRRCH